MKNKILKNVVKKLLKEDSNNNKQNDLEIFDTEKQFSDIYGNQFGVKNPITEEAFKRKSKLVLEKWNKLTFID